MGITLYVGSKNLSSWSLRPYLALAQTGALFEEVVVPLNQADTTKQISAFSPSGRVPVLEHDGVKVWDSLAICEYLAEAFPDANLWPGDRAARAVARSISAEMHSGFPAVRGEMPMHCAERLPTPALSADARAQVARIQEIWRGCRQFFGAGGPFLFGAFTIADAMFAPVVTRFRTYGVHIDSGARAYSEAIFGLPAMVQWIADAEREVAAAK